MMGTYIHWVLLFAWVLLFRKLIATGLIGTYIHRVLVIDGYLYSRVYGSTSPKDGVMMMSLGLYSNVWLRLIITGIQVVKGLTYKFWVESLAFTKPCPDIKFHAYWYYSY